MRGKRVKAIRRTLRIAATDAYTKMLEDEGEVSEDMKMAIQREMKAKYKLLKKR